MQSHKVISPASLQSFCAQKWLDLLNKLEQSFSQNFQTKKVELCKQTELPPTQKSVLCYVQYFKSLHTLLCRASNIESHMSENLSLLYIYPHTRATKGVSCYDTNFIDGRSVAYRNCAPCNWLWSETRKTKLPGTTLCHQHKENHRRAKCGKELLETVQSRPPDSSSAGISKQTEKCSQEMQDPVPLQDEAPTLSLNTTITKVFE